MELLAEIRFVCGRIRFTDEHGNTAYPAPFPSMIVIYNGIHKPERSVKYELTSSFSPSDVSSDSCTKFFT